MLMVDIVSGSGKKPIEQYRHRGKERCNIVSQVL